MQHSKWEQFAHNEGIFWSLQGSAFRNSDNSSSHLTPFHKSLLCGAGHHTTNNLFYPPTQHYDIGGFVGVGVGGTGVGVGGTGVGVGGTGVGGIGVGVGGTGVGVGGTGVGSTGVGVGGTGVGVGGTGVGVGGTGVGFGGTGVGVGAGVCTDRLTGTTVFAEPMLKVTWPVYLPGARLPPDTLTSTSCVLFAFNAPPPGETPSQLFPSSVAAVTVHLL